MISVLPSPARIGETVSESTARYGSPVSTVSKTADCQEIIFFKNGMVLTGKFFKGTCVELDVKKETCVSTPGEPLAVSDLKQFDEPEVKELLSQNAEGHQWSDGPSISSNGKACYYHRDDGAFAEWTFGAGLAISSSIPNPYDTEVEKKGASAATGAARNELHGL